MIMLEEALTLPRNEIRHHPLALTFVLLFFELQAATVYIRAVLSSFKVDVNAKRDVREPMKSAVNLGLPTHPTAIGCDSRKTGFLAKQ
jgi:hypothetical protein